MRPTPDQIERQRLVSLWRRRFTREPGMTFMDYDPYGVMDLIGLDWHGDGAEVYARRPDVIEPNITSSYGTNRIISNRPARPEATTPHLELPDEFPY